MNIKQRLASLKDVINKLRYILDHRQKVLGAFVIIMTVINAILQTLGISIIVPLVGAMTTPSETMRNRSVIFICNIFGINNSTSFFVMVCLATIVLYLLKDAFCVFQLWVGSKYSYKVQRELATAILKSYMNRTYDFFLGYGTSKVIRDIQNDSYGVNCILAALFSLITEFLAMFFITAYIVVMDWRMAICIVIIAYICIMLIYKYFKNKMREAGEQSRILAAESQKVLLEAVEGIKEVQVMHKQSFFVEAFQEAYTKEQKPHVVQRIVSESPTYIIEGVFIAGLMLFIAIRMVLDPNYATAMPVLASFMVGAVRMLPSLGRISSRLSGLSFDLPALNSVYNNIQSFKNDKTYNLVQSDDEPSEMSFKEKLSLCGITWRYPDTEVDVLKNLDLTISKGQSVGIIGQSGAGKSTLADVILGLHIPQNGSVELDGKSIKTMLNAYCRVIGYVPQTVYLIDGTIRENVAFGTKPEEIDDRLVMESLKQAKLDHFVAESEYGLDTIVGERGVKFSGGQRQRLAIARALYRKPQILILDEATSALDNETEAAVMDAIESLYGAITMVIIAHRLTTVKKCDVIYEVKDGKAVQIEKQELFGI